MVACVDYQCFVLHGMDFASYLYVSRCRTRGDDGFAGVSAGLIDAFGCNVREFHGIGNRKQNSGLWN